MKITHSRFNPGRVIPERSTPVVSDQPTVRLQGVRHPPVSDGASVFASFQDGSVRAYRHPGWDLLWQQKLSPSHPVDLRLVISDGGLHFVCDGGLFRCELDSGAVARLRDVDRECDLDTDLLDNGRLIRNAEGETDEAEDMRLACESVAGGELWSFPLEPVMLRCALEGNVFLCVQPTVDLFALDLRDGRELWRLPEEVCSWPLISKSRVYVGLPQNQVACLDANTGASIWRVHTPVQFPQNLSFYPDGNLYMMDHASLTVLDAGHGRTVHSHNVEKACDGIALYAPSDLLVTEGRVWVADVREGNCAAFDVDKGSLLWNSKLNGFVPYINTPFVIGDDLLFLKGSGELISFGGSR
jgi:outer membrane protein assembly factor BamB